MVVVGFPSSAMILLVVCSATGDGSALYTSKANSKVNLLKETNRAR